MFQFRVKELARQRGWTVEEVAQRSGVKFSTVKNLWQERTSDPSFSTVYLLAKAFEVPIEEFAQENEAVAQKNATPRVLTPSYVS